jgi:RNA polymerase sigma-70 factor, ECF subfamily
MTSKLEFVAIGRNSGAIDRSENNGSQAAGAEQSAISDGHSAALEEIWRTHGQQMLRITQRITNNREDAEDALQDSFLRAHVHLRSFDRRSSLATWLTRIAINSALMILRKRSSATQLSLDGSGFNSDSQAFDPADQSPSPESQYAQIERRAKVRSAIGRLRPSIRQALELQTVEGQPLKEIAARMGLSISATKSRIFHAKAALRKSLEPKIGRRSGRRKQLQLSPA